MRYAPADLVVSSKGARLGSREFSCSIGRAGIRAHKREGDGATPMGRFRLLGVLFRPDRVAAQELPGDATPLRPFDIWSDDPGDPLYNRRKSDRRHFAFSNERLFRSDPQYDVVIPVAYNWPDPRPGAGSAIFLHVWRAPRHPTAGCIAFRKSDLIWIANRIGDRTMLVSS